MYKGKSGGLINFSLYFLWYWADGRVVFQFTGTRYEFVLWIAYKMFNLVVVGVSSAEGANALKLTSNNFLLNNLVVITVT